MSDRLVEFFVAWDDIDDDHKRLVDGEREVLGLTFLGEPTWLPWMGPTKEEQP